MFDLFKDTQNFAFSLVQCCAKFEKAVPGNGRYGNGRHEWASKPATNIE